MLRLGGSKVEKGRFWSAVDGTVADMTGGGVLPGGRGVLYIRRPMGGMFVVVPLAALLYAVTFPALGPLAVVIGWSIALAGIGMAAVYGLVRSSLYVRELAAVGWRPVTAYFAGLTKKDKKRK